MQCACAVLSSVACPALRYFSTLSHKRHDFQKKKKIIIEHKICVLIFCTTSSETSHLKKKTERNMMKNSSSLHVKHLLFLFDFNET